MKQAISACICLVALFGCQDMQSQKEMVEMTASGYKYTFSEDVEGPTPQIGQYCMVHTVMSHGDSVLSDTRKYPGRPTLVSMDPPEKRRGSASGPVQDLLETMSVGDKARLHYPLDSFKTKPQRLAHLDEVVYDIELVQIFKSEQEVNNHYAAIMLEEQDAKKAMEKTASAVAAQLEQVYQTHKTNPESQSWQVTKSGLKYMMLEERGTGVKARRGERVRTHYYGIFAEDGEMFDNSYKRGSTFDFPFGEMPVIAGWTEALDDILEKGDKAIFFVPSDLAYGEQGFPGVIPPNTDLFFYMELVGVGDEE